MSFFAATMTRVHESELPLLIEVVFMVYALVSFIRIATYTTGQLRAGRLLNRRSSPLDFNVPRVWGWLFVGGVLILVFVQSVFYIFLVLMGTAAVLAENGRTAEEQFGLARIPLARVAQWSLLCCGAVLFVETPLETIWLWVMDAIHLPHPEQQTVETFRQYHKPLEVFSAMIEAVLFFPLIEELFFRGFLFPFLKKYTTIWFAIILSAGVFAFVHANLGAVIPLWFLGVVLAVAYQHTGSLLVPIGIHACWNFFTALSLLVDKANF